LPASPAEGLLLALALLDPSTTRQVLIVDDHPDSRRLIRRVLEAQGEYLIREAASGAEALADAHRSPPDLIILDLMMPDMDGLEVIGRLKAQPQTANLPVIVVTAKVLSGDEKKRLEGDFARLLTKGDLLSEDLLGEIARALK
jgi:threonine synthase